MDVSFNFDGAVGILLSKFYGKSLRITANSKKFCLVRGNRKILRFVQLSFNCVNG